MACYPSKCFPLPCEKYPPKPTKYVDDKGKTRYYHTWKDTKAYQKWDSWYVWRYLLEFKEDPEEIYQVGASEITEWIKRAEMIEKMKGLNM